MVVEELTKFMNCNAERQGDRNQLLATAILSLVHYGTVQPHMIPDA